MKDLNSLTKQELEEFFASFDQILSDVDGVLWLYFDSIPGTAGGIKSLQSLGKKVTFVSNNTTKSLDVYHKQLKTAGFDVEKDDIITPASAMIWYLKKQNFTKKIYLVGMSPIREEFENAGFRFAEYGPDRIKESLQEFVTNSLIDDEKVGAVVADVDINLNYVKLQRAAAFLKKPDVIFMTGATDCKVPAGKNHIMIGPGYFNKILEDITGRKACAMAKPSLHLNDYIVERMKIEDPKRILFIGDSIPEDMGFASKSGYKKLLVLSGLSRKEALLDWKYPEDYKPDYYVDSLKIIHDLIERHFGDRL